MPKLNRSVEYCDFCYTCHQDFAPEQPFNFGRKEGVAKCILCDDDDRNIMCRDCYKHSIDAINNQRLALLGIAVCKSCMVKKRPHIEEQISAIIGKHFETFRGTIHKDVYFLNKTMQGHW